MKHPELAGFKFSPDGEFFDVEGIPVSMNAGVPGLFCAAWDTSPPRKFDPASAERNGARISEEKFRRLVQQAFDDECARRERELKELTDYFARLKELEKRSIVYG